jgi:hypothetical protein
MSTDTPLTWWNDLEHLQHALRRVCDKRADAYSWGLLLEFTVPRKLSRLDVVLLAGEQIILLECKTGLARADARRQVETYALLLHYFHAESRNRQILPVVVSASERDEFQKNEERFRLNQAELAFEALPSYWIRPVQFRSWDDLPDLLFEVDTSRQSQLDAGAWDHAPYRPTPTIIEAACDLRSGLTIREIAMSEAAEQEISAVTQEILGIIETSEREKQHSICFLTGVPGSGKTLVGLSLAHLSDPSTSALHFMSGGPLVSVLQEVFRRQAMRDGVPASAALVQAQTLIENVHVFAKNYTELDRDRAPSNHVIIFDEAQRAWNFEKNLRKFKRNYSEPEMLLKIMERHEHWACIVALVGGGQEINSGEAGLEEWGRALVGSDKRWTVHASPEVMDGGTSTAGRRLFDPACNALPVNTSNMLHLRTSNRSLRADNLARWVNHVLAGEIEEASAMRIADRFPISLTRKLSTARTMLPEQALGESRYGLVGSSKAARLRAEGLEPDSSFHASYPWHHWYLSPREDVRSSFACEVFASEFEIQGLELDWIGLCWGGDLVWNGAGWTPRKLWQAKVPKWAKVKNPTEQEFRRNSYRVLLTRARQGMVIFVPKGDPSDATRDPGEFDRVAEVLLRCGVRSLDGVSSEQPDHEADSLSVLF